MNWVCAHLRERSRAGYVKLLLGRMRPQICAQNQSPQELKPKPGRFCVTLTPLSASRRFFFYMLEHSLFPSYRGLQREECCDGDHFVGDTNSNSSSCDEFAKVSRDGSPAGGRCDGGRRQQRDAPYGAIDVSSGRRRGKLFGGAQLRITYRGPASQSSLAVCPRSLFVLLLQLLLLTRNEGESVDNDGRTLRECEDGKKFFRLELKTDRYGKRAEAELAAALIAPPSNRPTPT